MRLGLTMVVAHTTSPTVPTILAGGATGPPIHVGPTFGEVFDLSVSQGWPLYADYQYGLGGYIWPLADANGDGLDELAITSEFGVHVYLSPHVSNRDVVSADWPNDISGFSCFLGALADGASVGLAGSVLCLGADRAIRALERSGNGYATTELVPPGAYAATSLLSTPHGLLVGGAGSGRFGLQWVRALNDERPLDERSDVWEPSPGTFTGIFPQGCGNLDGVPVCVVRIRVEAGPGGEERLLLVSQPVVGAPDAVLTVHPGSATSSLVGGSALADVDGDGHTDLLVGSSGQVQIFRGPLSETTYNLDDADLTFVVDYPSIEGFGGSIAAADIDDDGVIEVAVAAPGADFGAGIVFLFEDILGPWHRANPGFR